jgi:hypothetical protein
MQKRTALFLSFFGLNEKLGIIQPPGGDGGGDGDGGCGDGAGIGGCGDAAGTGTAAAGTDRKSTPTRFVMCIETVMCWYRIITQLYLKYCNLQNSCF